MNGSGEMGSTQEVKYFLASSEGVPIEKTLPIDSNELQKNVLLQIYYCDMLKIKARTVGYMQNVIR